MHSFVWSTDYFLFLNIYLYLSMQSACTLCLCNNLGTCESLALRDRHCFQCCRNACLSRFIPFSLLVFTSSSPVGFMVMVIGERVLPIAEGFLFNFAC